MIFAPIHLRGVRHRGMQVKWRMSQFIQLTCLIGLQIKQNDSFVN